MDADVEPVKSSIGSNTLETLSLSNDDSDEIHSLPKKGNVSTSDIIMSLHPTTTGINSKRIINHKTVAMKSTKKNNASSDGHSSVTATDDSTIRENDEITWLCDHCRVVTFSSYDSVIAHEKKCRKRHTTSDNQGDVVSQSTTPNDSVTTMPYNVVRQENRQDEEEDDDDDECSDILSPLNEQTTTTKTKKSKLKRGSKALKKSIRNVFKKSNKSKESSDNASHASDDDTRSRPHSDFTSEVDHLAVSTHSSSCSHYSKSVKGHDKVSLRSFVSSIPDDDDEDSSRHRHYDNNSRSSRRRSRSPLPRRGSKTMSNVLTTVSKKQLPSPQKLTRGVSKTLRRLTPKTTTSSKDSTTKSSSKDDQTVASSSLSSRLSSRRSKVTKSGSIERRHSRSSSSSTKEKKSSTTTMKQNEKSASEINFREENRTTTTSHSKLNPVETDKIPTTTPHTTPHARPKYTRSLTPVGLRHRASTEDMARAIMMARRRRQEEAASLTTTPNDDLSSSRTIKGGVSKQSSSSSLLSLLNRAMPSSRGNNDSYARYVTKSMKRFRKTIETMR